MQRKQADGPAKSRSRANPENYRGRRRLPKLPSKRYAAVVAFAFVAAAVVAGAAGVAVPDRSSEVQDMAIMDRINAMDQINREQNRPGVQVAIDQAAPEVWKLPVNRDDCPYSVTSKYGPRWGTQHYGVDLACPAGSAWGYPIYAVHSGEVTYVDKIECCYGYGRHVRIYHGPDTDGNPIETVYGHASTVVVDLGQRVKAGQLIGYVGNTGDSSGAHLHFEVNVVDATNYRGMALAAMVRQHLDPLPYLKTRGLDIENFKSAAEGDDVVVDTTDGRALPSPSATPSPTGTPSP